MTAANNSFKILGTKTLSAHSSTEYLMVELRFEGQKGVNQARGENDHSRPRKQRYGVPVADSNTAGSGDQRGASGVGSRARGQREDGA